MTKSVLGSPRTGEAYGHENLIESWLDDISIIWNALNYIFLSSRSIQSNMKKGLEKTIIKIQISIHVYGGVLIVMRKSVVGYKNYISTAEW